MKNRILLILLICLTFTGMAIAQDTLWINATTNGALEAAINADTIAGGARKFPLRTYGLHKDGIYVQNAGIVFKGGTMLRIIGEKGGGYPVVQMQPVNGVDPGDLTNGIANKVEGSLFLDHIYWIGKTTDGTQYNELFGMTTVNNLQQKCIVNDCITEFIGIDTFNGDSWNHGSIWKFTNCYFRSLFNGTQWWAARVMYCKKPIDTLWVENCTVSNGGLTFLQQEAVTRFAYFNHNTFINNHKYWLLNGYYQNLFITNNLFTNQNWVGEDSLSVATGGQDPDGQKPGGRPMYMGTISVDTITIHQQLFSDMINPDSTVDLTKVGLDKMRIYVSNNISWTDTLLNAYYTNRGNTWNTVGPYPVSYLNWASGGPGPWQVFNVPGMWMNRRTSALFAQYKGNMAATHNIFTKVDTKTTSIASPAIATLMGQWNQNQYADPAFPTATTLLVNSIYVPGDQSASTLPGFNGITKSENGLTAGVAKISDFIENYDQAASPVNSTIDLLPIGALTWHDATVPASSYTSVLAHYLLDITGITTLPGVAGEFKLTQNYPNPFNPSTKIDFSIPSAGQTQLKVYNILGQEVATLVNENVTVGNHSVTFDASRLASGVYLYKLVSGSFVSTKKMVLLK